MARYLWWVQEGRSEFRFFQLLWGKGYSKPKHRFILHPFAQGAFTTRAATTVVELGAPAIT